jgi:hypothetical protein
MAPTPLETKSSIPANLPLESIAARFVVPRDVNPEAYAVQEVSTLPPQASDLDERITVPAGAALPEIVPPPSRVSEELVEKDVFLTGEVNFLANEELREKQARKNLIDRAYSIVLHVAVVLLLIFQPKLFSRRPPSAAEQEIARKQMTLILPPGAFESARPEPRVVTPPPRVKVDPRILRQIAPPEPVAPPQPVQPKVEPKRTGSAAQRQSAASACSGAETGNCIEQRSQTGIAGYSDGSAKSHSSENIVEPLARYPAGLVTPRQYGRYQRRVFRPHAARCAGRERPAGRRRAGQQRHEWCVPNPHTHGRCRLQRLHGPRPRQRTS